MATAGQTTDYGINWASSASIADGLVPEHAAVTERIDMTTAGQTTDYGIHWTSSASIAEGLVPELAAVTERIGITTAGQATDYVINWISSASIAEGLVPEHAAVTGRIDMTTAGQTTDYGINWTSSEIITELTAPEYLITIVFILGILLSVVGAVGNILVLVVIASTKELRKTYNLCIGSLALNDMLLCLFTNMSMAVGIWLRKSPLSSPFCLFHNMLWSHLLFVSILNVSLISLLRFILVVHQKISDRLQQNKSITLSIILIFHIITFFLITFDKIGRDTWFDPNMGLCWIVGDTSSRVYMFVAAIVVEILTTLVSYVGILVRVRAQKRRVNTVSNTSQIQAAGNNLKKNIQHLKIVRCMIVIIITTLLFTVFPIISLSFVLKMQKISPSLHLLIPVVVWTFSLSNGAIYCIYDKTFRKGYTNLFKCKIRIGTGVQ